jgi:hypothetical protein
MARYEARGKLGLLPGAKIDAALEVYRAEAGIQGTEYGFADEDRYVLASLVLRFNAFRGGADQAALREARACTQQ